jgi:CRP-like cAMP-binding protein
MYIIVRGRVAIKTEHPNKEILHTILNPGSFFGELSLIESDSLRTATAEALERTVIISFFKPDLVEIVERKPETGVKILFQLSKVLGRRLIETTEKITLLTRGKKTPPGR